MAAPSVESDITLPETNNSTPEVPAMPETPVMAAPSVESDITLPETNNSTPEVPAMPEAPVMAAPSVEPNITLPETNNSTPEVPAMPEAPVMAAPSSDSSVISIDSLLSDVQNNATPTNDIPTSTTQNNVQILKINVTNASGDGKQRSMVVSEKSHANLMNKKTEEKVLTLAA